MALFHNLLKAECLQEDGPDDDERMSSIAAGCWEPSWVLELCAEGVLAPLKPHPAPQTHIYVWYTPKEQLFCALDALMTTQLCSAPSQMKWQGGVGSGKAAPEGQTLYHLHTLHLSATRAAHVGLSTGLDPLSHCRGIPSLADVPSIPFSLAKLQGGWPQSTWTCPEPTCQP